MALMPGLMKEPYSLGAITAVLNLSTFACAIFAILFQIDNILNEQRYIPRRGIIFVAPDEIRGEEITKPYMAQSSHLLIDLPSHAPFVPFFSSK